MEKWNIGFLLLSVLLVIHMAETFHNKANTEDHGRVVIHLEQGSIEGLQQQSLNGRKFHSFKTIPYAKPPEGNLRLEDPQPADPWEGILDGTRASPQCPQLLKDFRQEWNDLRGQEDCLYLNVYAPELENLGALLPVMVFIHGGAFYSGSAVPYAPDTLMNEDVVLVTINYRLGVLGFLSTEDDVMPGNFGLKDQTLALQWVQKNIARFGGDPKTVTIFGQSAGAASVDYQVLTPYSEGLFSRAILHSGSSLCPWARGGSYRELAEYVGEKVNCKLDNGVAGSSKFKECLKKVNFSDVAPIYSDFKHFTIFSVMFTPRVDGDYLPQHPEQLLRDGLHKKVDVIAGVAKDEAASYTLSAYLANKFTSLKENFDIVGPTSLEFFKKEENEIELTKAVFHKYLNGKDMYVESVHDLNKMLSDRQFLVCTDLSAMFYARNMVPSKKTFAYMLTYRPRSSLQNHFEEQFNKTWVSHADDMVFLFNGPVFFLPTDDNTDLKLSKIITRMWVNFATNGNPTPDDSLGFKWEPTATTPLHYLDINLNPEMKKDAHKESLEYWKTVPTKQNKILYPHGAEGREEL